MADAGRFGVAAYCSFETDDASDGELHKLRGVFRAIVGGRDRQRFPGLNDITALMLLCYVSPSRTRGEARRHVLLEGAPGTAKSELTKAVGKALMEFGKPTREAGYLRIQGTPDLLPANFTGSELRKRDGAFEFVKGPLVQDTSILHVDEINRISSRTLAVLFEAMAEAQVTLTSLLVEPDKRECDLEWLFVVGTQNPASFIGTNLLPEPLLDRFMVRAVMPYPGKDLLSSLILSLEDDPPPGALPQPRRKKKEVTAEDKVAFAEIRKRTSEVVGAPLNGSDTPTRRNKSIANDIAAVLLASWPSEAAGSIPELRRQLPVEKRLRTLVDTSLDQGLGVRAGQSLRDLASAVAWCRSGGKVDTVVAREDMELIAPYVLGHRLRFKPGTFRTPDEQMAFVSRFLNLVWQWQDSL